MAEGIQNQQNFVDFSQLELLGLPYSAPHGYAYSQENGCTPRSMDSIDRLLDNCHLSFCPLLQAKVSTRYAFVKQFVLPARGQADCKRCACIG